jgi:hypothetical protein
VVFVISRSYVTVLPAGGDLASKSVEILKPSCQQLRVFGEFVQAPSGAEEVAARSSTATGVAFKGSLGMVPAKASEPSGSQ